MRIRSSKNQPQKVQPVDKLMDTTRQSYRKFMDYVAFRDDDPLWMLAYKLGARVVISLIFLALSPFLLISFLIAISVAA